MQQTLRSIHRQIFTFFALCLTIVDGSAQTPSLQVTLTIPSVLPSSLDEWHHGADKAQLLIINRSDSAKHVKVRTVIRCDSVIVLYTRLTDVTAILIDRQPIVATLDDFLPQSAVQFMTTFGERCARNGRLTPGVYSIRCQAVDADNTDKILAQTDPAPFTISGITAAQLLEPVQYRSITSTKPVRFMWMGIKPSPRAELGIRYKLLIYEAPKGMDAQAVVETMEPTMELWSTVDSPTSISVAAGKFHWSMKHDYVWTVRAVDKDGHAYGEPEGLAEPRVLRVKH